jgi:hypothetical protein
MGQGSEHRNGNLAQLSGRLAAGPMWYRSFLDGLGYRDDGKPGGRVAQAACEKIAVAANGGTRVAHFSLAQIVPRHRTVCESTDRHLSNEP